MKNLGLLSFVKSGFYSGDLNELKGLDAEYSLINARMDQKITS